jgi:acetolactate synthase-1/2/3 large subunit
MASKKDIDQTSWKMGVKLFAKAERPVIILGYGIRSSGADPTPLLKLGIPVLASWQAADLVDNEHICYFGRPGVYGQRVANEVLYNADVILAVGNRMSPWQIGYSGLRPEQKLIMVDIDRAEVERFPNATWINEDAGKFIDRMDKRFIWQADDWLETCCRWRSQYPLVEHSDANGFMNSYRIVDRLQKWLRPDEVIVTDVGGMMCPPFQVLRLKPPQRLMTSGGLGEMGMAIPAAIGASFARNKGEVLCLVGDGGAMLNLQELQTIVYHKLPVKIILFENGGYSMIKHTQKNLSLKQTGVGPDSGLSFPNFRWLAHSFGMLACDVSKWDEFDTAMDQLFAAKEPSMVVIHMDPEQKFVPKLEPTIHPDGRIDPAQFNVMSPLL